MKHFFNLAKIFVLRLFKMGQIKQTTLKVNRDMSPNFLWLRSANQCECYRRMWDVYGEAYLSKTMFINGLNIGLPNESVSKRLSMQ